MPSEIKASPRNPYTGAAADALKWLNDKARQYEVKSWVPLLGGTGVNELLSLPGAASLMDDVSYYGPSAVVKGGNAATGGIGTYRLDPRVADLVDVGTMAAPMAGALGKAGTRGAKAGARLVGEELNRAILDSSGPLARLVPEAAKPLYAVKPKGGNWLAGSVENAVAPLKQRVDPELEGYARRGQNLMPHEAEEVLPKIAINDWLDSKLTKYIRNEMGTPEDPVRALAERGVLHYEPQGGAVRAHAHRSLADMSTDPTAVGPLARAWEDVADAAILPGSYAEHTPIGGFSEEALRKLGGEYAVKNPQATAYSMDIGTRAPDLGFSHLVDELRNAINPESGLPANLRLSPEQLSKVSTPQAVELVHKINQYRAAEKAAADLARATGPATHLFKEYPEAGYKWVELKLPESVDPAAFANDVRIKRSLGDTVESRGPRLALEDALKYEGETMGHCVGGYCEDVASGRSRIFSLRDKKGQPHVTIEVKPGAFSSPEEALKYEQAPENGLSSIIQIKGKSNRAPNAEYLPYVQDFVRSGNWGRVGDLQNTGLISYKGEYRLPEEFLYRTDEGGWEPLVDVAKRAFPDSPAKQLNFYRGASELENDIKLKPQGEGFAEGGLVTGITENVDPFHSDTLTNPANEHYFADGGAAGYAGGGAVEASTYDPARVDDIVNQIREGIYG